MRRRQLLFYLCVPPGQLGDLLLREDGGDARRRAAPRPALWLLEAGSGEAVCPESLGHYHDEGTTAYLPCTGDGTEPRPRHVADPGRPPVAAELGTLRSVVERAGLPPPPSAAGDRSGWTLPEYAAWADATLDRAALDRIFARIVPENAFEATDDVDDDDDAPREAPSGAAPSPRPCGGLDNLGKSAWMNAVLQGLSHAPLARAHLLSGAYEADVNEDNPLGSEGRMIGEAAAVLRSMRGPAPSVRPSRFASVLNRCNSQFAAGEPNDAGEFLRYLSDILHEDANLVRKKPYVKALGQDWMAERSIETVAREVWRR